MLPDMEATDVIHWFMVPMYTESPDILLETIEAIRDTEYDLSKVAVTLHGEAHRKDCFDAALQACLPLKQYF